MLAYTKILNWLRSNYKLVIAIILALIISLTILNRIQRTPSPISTPSIIIQTIASSTAKTSVNIKETQANTKNLQSWAGKKAEVILTETFTYEHQTKTIPIGTVTLNPNADTPITTEIPAREYVVTTTVTPDKAPTSSLTINGVDIPVKTNFIVKKESIFGLRPALILGATLSNNLELQGNIGASINFIKYKSFSFLSPGLVYTQNQTTPDIALSLTPLAYHIGANIGVGLMVTKSILREDYSVGLTLTLDIK